LAAIGPLPFSSGCTHAQWAIVGARCEDIAGNVATRYLLVPMREVEIIDDCTCWACAVPAVAR